MAARRGRGAGTVLPRPAGPPAATQPTLLRKLSFLDGNESQETYFRTYARFPNLRTILQLFFFLRWLDTYVA